MKLIKIDPCTYMVSDDSSELFYFVEQMEDRKWDAYACIDPENRIGGVASITWGSFAHKTRRDVLTAISSHKRRANKNQFYSVITSDDI